VADSDSFSVTDLDVGAADLLPLDLQHHAYRAVHGRVRRAHVERQRLDLQVGRVGQAQVLGLLEADHHPAARRRRQRRVIRCMGHQSTPPA
jgi:hypothetical protein